MLGRSSVAEHFETEDDGDIVPRGVTAVGAAIDLAFTLAERGATPDEAIETTLRVAGGGNDG